MSWQDFLMELTNTITADDIAGTNHCIARVVWEAFLDPKSKTPSCPLYWTVTFVLHNTSEDHSCPLGGAYVAWLTVKLLNAHYWNGQKMHHEKKSPYIISKHCLNTTDLSLRHRTDYPGVQLSAERPQKLISWGSKSSNQTVWMHWSGAARVYGEEAVIWWRAFKGIGLTVQLQKGFKIFHEW